MSTSTHSPATHAVQIEVWSDYVCPFCYLAEPALTAVAADQGVDVLWRAFELRPDPVPPLDPKGDYIQQAWKNSVLPMAAERGMKLSLPSVQPRSRLAHEATAFAATKGKATTLRHLIFRAFFEQNRDIGDTRVLTELAREAGLEAQEFFDALTQGTFRKQVLDEEQLAKNLGLSGVPAIVVRPASARYNQAVLVEGAQPAEVIRNAVAQVREDFANA